VGNPETRMERRQRILPGIRPDDPIRVVGPPTESFA
jgi:hypothetical protein